jgi:hypothetical protein
LAVVASEARCKYAQAVASKASPGPKPLLVPAAARESETRRLNIKKVTKAAARKLRQEAAAKKAKADARQLELVNEAAVECFRHEFGRKQKLTPTAL